MHGGKEMAASVRRPVGACPMNTEHMRILALLAQGMNEQEIAAREFLSYRTVRRRIREVMRWHAIRTKAQLGAETVRRGWATAPCGPGCRAVRTLKRRDPDTLPRA